MRFELKWGYRIKNVENIALLKEYFGDTFDKECASKEYNAENLFEVDVCGKVWVNLNSEEDFLKNGREISKNAAEFVKNGMKEHGYKFLYSRILRDEALELSGFGKENRILDLSVDRIVKCYKKESGKIVMSDIMFKYSQTGFEAKEICPAIEKN